MLALCQLLLAAKADVAAKNNAGHTPLHLACNSGQVRAQLAAAPPVPATPPLQPISTPPPPPLPPPTPQASIAQWLLPKEADPNDADKAGDTPLHVAARAGFPQVVAVLLAGGAKQSSNRAGKTPAQVALDKGVVKLLEKAEG